MSRLPFLLILLLAVLAGASHAVAQSDSSQRRIVLVDGTVLVGTVENENADPVVIISRDGVEQRVPRSRVAEITRLINGKFYRIDPTRTRLVLSPTARTLGESGTARLGLSLYIFPSVTYGVTDRIDVTGAAFYLFGAGGGLIIGGAKGQVLDTEMVDVALGFTAVAPIAAGEDFNGAFIGLPYAVVTVGSEVAAASIGVSGFVGGDVTTGDFDSANAFVVSLGGEYQLSNSFKLIGDFLIPVAEGTTAFSVAPGVRFFGDRFSADVYGVFASDGTESGGFAPFVNFGLKF